MCARPTLLYLCISECEYVCAPVHIWGSCTPVWDNSTAGGLVCCVWIIKVVSLIIKSSLSWWEPEEGDGARERGRERGIIVSAAGVHARSLSSIVYCGWDVSWAQVFSALCARPLSSPRHIRSRAHTYSYIRARCSGVYRHSRTESNTRIASFLGSEGLGALLQKHLPHVAAVTVLFSHTVLTTACKHLKMHSSYIPVVQMCFPNKNKTWRFVFLTESFVAD